MSLNRQQRERFTATHIAYKYNLLHYLPGIEQSQLSGLYLKSFYNGTKRNRLHLPEHLTNGTKFCEKCGVVHIAGLNLNMAIVDVMASDDESVHNQVLEYKCLLCGKVKQFDIGNSKRIESQQGPREGFVAKWPSGQKTSHDAAEVNGSQVKKLASGKERAKKRKMNTLANMLSRKKDEEANKKSASLNLEDFLLKR
ncbi:LADA_0G01112g1_1 [Lachancea dasiensis]|uniref:LADA_0G01112g1_1 n=1 Tax=Lachancea dasiensis TaxID=1072105 RepID=A0A1G4JQM6_9SACH|nr:LADA_0G01112g1_1 [Lachancea dasiensis]